MDNKQKLFVVTVWDKDIKRWYNYHFDKEEKNINKSWWINNRFEKYKEHVKKNILEIRRHTDKCEYIRFFLTTTSQASDYCLEYGIKDKISVVKNFSDRLYTQGKNAPAIQSRTDIENYLKQNTRLKSKLGDSWLKKLKTEQKFYFYCSKENFEDVQSEVNSTDWEITMGEDFIQNYNLKPENLILITLDDDKLKEYLKGLSSDFTIFGFGSKDIKIDSDNWVDQVNWLFALGVELDPQKEALLFNFSFKNIPFEEKKDNVVLKKFLIEENYKRKLQILCNATQKINGIEILKQIKGKNNENQI